MKEIPMALQENHQSVDVLRQFVSGLIDFSSQYGSDRSVAYVVKNIIGPPSRYPAYGDYTDTCVFRTYGPWWTGDSWFDSVEQTASNAYFVSDDFVELLYDFKVYITEVNIYETYNPGAIVRILANNEDARHSNEKWFILWQIDGGKPPKTERSSRIFAPPIRRPPFPTKTIRLEFLHHNLDYYTEIDAVELVGCTDVSVDIVPEREHRFFKNPNTSSSGSFDLELLVLTDDRSNGWFDILPVEVVVLILGFLSLEELGWLSCVSKLFYDLCCSGHLFCFHQLNLQPYWFVVNDGALEGFHKKCSTLKSLNVSWCGSHELFSAHSFMNFIQLHGDSLQHLQMDSAPFLTDSLLKNIIASCPNLTELSLASNAERLSCESLYQISQLGNLKKANLYRSSLDLSTAHFICSGCKHLEHLNVGACYRISDYDELLKVMSRACRSIKSLDLWRAETLTSVGLTVLVNKCPLLESLDVGWCKNLHPQAGDGPSWVTHLAESCGGRLRKLFVTANRSISDHDLFALAEHCPNIEQLDILGNSSVTFTGVERILNRCSKLKLFDISFCSQVDFRQYDIVRKTYMNCCIKKSFQQ